MERGLLEIYRFVSPSSRRAWIEIAASSPPGASAAASPSSRRAWIEILVAREVKRAALVALLAEGVDRNHEDNMLFVVDEGRPPRGGCG